MTENGKGDGENREEILGEPLLTLVSTDVIDNINLLGSLPSSIP